LDHIRFIFGAYDERRIDSNLIFGFHDFCELSQILKILDRTFPENFAMR